MKAQVILSTAGAKHLIAKALSKYIDFSKKVYIAYGSTNWYLLYHLGIKKDSYMAGCNVNGCFNVTKTRDKIVFLNSENFEIDSDSYFIKGANALWYEDGKKQAAVAAADESGGTYGNFYVKAAIKGAKIIIPVGHEKLIPGFVETSHNVDYSMGSKVAMLRFFKGEVFTEIEAFKVLFDVEAKPFLAGGIEDLRGGVGFLIEGKGVKESIEFIKKHNELFIERGAYIF
jgi:hypothetical protein